MEQVAVRGTSCSFVVLVTVLWKRVQFGTGCSFVEQVAV